MKFSLILSLFCCLFLSSKASYVFTTFFYENSDSNCQTQVIKFIYSFDPSPKTCADFGLINGSPNCSRDPSTQSISQVVCNSNVPFPPPDHLSGNYAIQLVSQGSCSGAPVYFFGDLLNHCSAVGQGFVKNVCSLSGLVKTSYTDQNCVQAAGASDNFILGCSDNSGLFAVTTCPATGSASKSLHSLWLLVSIFVFIIVL